MADLRLLVIVFVVSFSYVASQPLKPPKSLLIDCGSAINSTIEDRNWLADTGYITSGISRTLNTTVFDPTLSTIRSFPLTKKTEKFCYIVPVKPTVKYLIRTTYYYGGINNGKHLPPVFDQIVDGTVWTVVNTTDDYVRRDASYYEGVFLAKRKSTSVCIGANTYTDSDPFISALELVELGASVYNSTDFNAFGLSLIARSNFGYNGSIIKFPDDPFGRCWEPFGNSNPVIRQSTQNVSVSGFWNLPPSKIFETQIATDTVGPIKMQWPPGPLPNSRYYISLYFADLRDSPSGKSRVFNISLNGVTYYPNLNVSPAGVDVFSKSWPLSGLTDITLTPAFGSDVGPVINGGEIFNVLPLGGRTHNRDATAMEKVKNSLQNPPQDWNGDPCLPRHYAWSGVACSEGSRIMVVSLNMSGMGLSGSISANIANLTALTDIWLGNNNLSGSIPDLSKLKRLKTLHLENNQLSGEIPSSLGNIGSLNELFLYNNNLTGEVPNSLITKSGLNLKTTPGNRLSFSSPSPTLPPS
ncbi:hypothetical protein ACHQM5_027134 [Ranunculus cassubicifolius]